MATFVKVDKIKNGELGRTIIIPHQIFLCVSIFLAVVVVVGGSFSPQSTSIISLNKNAPTIILLRKKKKTHYKMIYKKKYIYVHGNIDKWHLLY